MRREGDWEGWLDYFLEGVATVAIEALEATGVLVETTGKKRDRVYAYRSYLDLLRVGTELGAETAQEARHQ